MTTERSAGGLGGPHSDREWATRGGIRRCLVGLAAAAGLAAVSVGTASADGSCWLPAGLSGAGLSHEIPPAPTPPPAGWSDVLAYVPTYPEAELAYYATHIADPEPSVEALYDVGAASPGDVARWYWDHLPEQGWMLAEDGDDYRRWTRGDGWLTVFAGYEVAGGHWLRLVRDPGGARSSSASALGELIPLPDGARRWRYDRTDLLPEEWRVPMEPPQAAAAMASMLAADGWQERASAGVGAAKMTSYSRERESLVVALWAAADGLTELAVGEAECLPVDSLTGPGSWRTMSVYLEAVPAPPSARIVGFQNQADGGKATEHWSASCLDIDVFGAALGERLGEADWSGPPGTSARAPGRCERTSVPPDGGDGVTYAAAVSDEAGLLVQVTRQSRGRRAPESSSLLFEDLPLPPGASAELMQTDTLDQWQYKELYAHDSGGDPEAFYRAQMPGRGWTYERGDGAAADPWHVYYSGGEEVQVDVLEAGSSVSLARRRVCAGGDPIPPDDVGLPSRHLLEMPVYPGAVDVGYSDGEETYYVSCTSLDLIGGWYRTVLESGEWALAGTVGPEDPFHRELLFVRPGERPLPPEERTAWAEVLIDRDWPYQYTLRLRRDPGGVRTQPAAP